MSDISELVKRLREPERPLNADRREAADALETQAAEIERLKTSLNEWVRENAPGGWIDILRSQARESGTKVKRLRAALERVQFMSQTAHNERLAAINATATAALEEK